MRKKIMSLLVAAFALGAPTVICAQTPQELFRSMKEQITAGAWAEALTTLSRLESAASAPENETIRFRLAGPIAFYRGVCQANLGRSDEAEKCFREFLTLEPNATMDPRAFSSAAARAFESAQKANAAQGVSLAESYRRFHGETESADDPADPRWADGPVKWIMTPDERTRWSTLNDPNERLAFAESFWSARLALSGRDGRSFRQEFERRVAFADRKFGEGETRGSLTDRGMVFVLLGPPLQVAVQRLRGESSNPLDGGASRIGSQDESIAMRSSPAATASRLRSPSAGIKAMTWAKYQDVQNKSASLEDETLETWNYGDQLLPMGAGLRDLDVHYLTKHGTGRRMLQQDPGTVNALSAAAQQGAGKLAASAP